MPERVLLDTDVFSYLLDRRPEAEVFRPFLRGRTRCLSFISLGELYYGAYKRQSGEVRFRGLCRAICDTLCIPYDDRMPECYGRIVAECERMGQPMEIHDAWIAATAIVHCIPLVTNNVKHYGQVNGLDLVCPEPA